MNYPGFSGMEVVTKQTVSVSGQMGVPGVCVLTGDGDGPFLDTQIVLNTRTYGTVEPWAIITVQKVIDMGRAVGMVPKEDVERLRERVDAQDERVRELEKLLDAYTTIKDAEEVLTGAAA